MVKQIFKLDLTEKDYLDRIVTISGIDKTIVKEVLQSILKMITIELYSENYEIIIPYLLQLNVSSHEKLTGNGVETIVELQASPSNILVEEVKAINEGEITPSQMFIRQRTFKEIEDKLET